MEGASTESDHGSPERLIAAKRWNLIILEGRANDGRDGWKIQQPRSILEGKIQRQLPNS
jgi:hypothetical protein